MSYNVDVVGIMGGASRELASYFVKSKGIKIPVATDSLEFSFTSARIGELPVTPLKILVDTSGIVLHTSMTTYSNKGQQKLYMKEIVDLL